MRESNSDPAQRRRQQEARRQPEKDRSAHEAARGKKTGQKTSLSSLSKEELTEDEFDAALAAMGKESDRGAVIIGAALIERELANIMTFALIEDHDKNGLFFDQGAPFQTFRNKIKAAHALGLCAKDIADMADVIRTIRNAFSHTPKPIDFLSPEISLECKKLRRHLANSLDESMDSSAIPDRLVYQLACVHVGGLIAKEGLRRSRLELRRSKTRLKKLEASLAKGADAT